ncbi:uncharacterized protein LY89DRAFT_205373 [Mollisia scopiformis]|uniref:Uncharacterized protein n=1 Tax=Mollisia scopiformis TaxID=149040 RepID=A0A194WXK6_MOLSC|nr:uncharacterized protein LY89DRAFT_205373 [Mollisia scopiformis]KUJ12317.1 hypothetical protein LY89DRAFT_205373 [Mollisia scopiformis]
MMPETLIQVIEISGYEINQEQERASEPKELDPRASNPISPTQLLNIHFGISFLPNAAIHSLAHPQTLHISDTPDNGPPRGIPSRNEEEPLALITLQASLQSTATTLPLLTTLQRTKLFSNQKIKSSTPAERA